MLDDAYPADTGPLGSGSGGFLSFRPGWGFVGWG
jgi:hypothetical protein